jgi:hypothetical protein
MAHPRSVERARAIPVTPEEAFARTLPVSLPTLFRQWFGPIPPIKEVRDQHGGWSSVGETRTIVLAGGGTMRETLTAVDPGHSFGYTISDITGPMAPLIDHVEGTWIFDTAGTGTKVTWRWVLYPKSFLTASALPVFALLWRGYAAQALESLSDHLVG